MAAVVVALVLRKKHAELYKKHGKLPPSKLEMRLEEMRRIGKLVQEEAPPVLVVNVQVHSATLLQSLESRQLKVRLKVDSKVVLTTKTVEPRRPSGLYRAVGRVTRACRGCSDEPRIPAPEPAGDADEGLRIPFEASAEPGPAHPSEHGDSAAPKSFTYSGKNTLVFELLESRVLLPTQVVGRGSFELSEAAVKRVLESRKDSKKAAKKAKAKAKASMKKAATFYEEKPEVCFYTGQELLGMLRISVRVEVASAAETAPVEAADVLVPPESSPMQEREVAAEAPAAPDLLLPNAVIAIRPGGSPRPASKSDRMVETKALVDRMLELRKSHGLDLWMEVFEVFDLAQQDVDLKFLESKKRAIALRLHPDKVDDQMAKYCGGRDRVYEAYYFLDEAFDQAKAWLKEHGQGSA